jgi:hypothetical protein
MPYLLKMTPQLTKWLMAALMALAVAQCAPVSRVEGFRATCGVVHTDSTQRIKISAARTALQLRDELHSFCSLSLLVRGTDSSNLTFHSLNPTLFQRPPPASLDHA